MDRAGVIRAFENDVVARLQSQSVPVQIETLFYYSYDAAGKTAMCDDTAFDKRRNLAGVCYSGVIDPLTGALLPDVAAAVVNSPTLLR
jgi:hypothetical protein